MGQELQRDREATGLCLRKPHCWGQPGRGDPRPPPHLIGVWLPSHTFLHQFPSQSSPEMIDIFKHFIREFIVYVKGNQGFPCGIPWSLEICSLCGRAAMVKGTFSEGLGLVNDWMEETAENSMSSGSPVTEARHCHVASV